MSSKAKSVLRLRIFIFISVMISSVSFVVSWRIFLDMPKSREFSYITSLDIAPLLLFGFLIAAMLVPKVAQDILMDPIFNTGVILVSIFCIADAAIGAWYIFGGISPVVSFDKLGIDPHILSYIQLIKLFLVFSILALGYVALRVCKLVTKINVRGSA